MHERTSWASGKTWFFKKPRYLQRIRDLCTRAFDEAQLLMLCIMLFGFFTFLNSFFKNDDIKLYITRIDTPCRELSNGCFGSVIALLVCWQINVCASAKVRKFNPAASLQNVCSRLASTSLMFVCFHVQSIVTENQARCIYCFCKHKEGHCSKK